MPQQLSVLEGNYMIIVIASGTKNKITSIKICRTIAILQEKKGNHFYVVSGHVKRLLQFCLSFRTVTLPLISHLKIPETSQK